MKIKPTATTYVIKDLGWDRALATIKGIKQSYVSIGVHEEAGSYQDGPQVFEVALWNEFGTKDIPERSFFRSALDENIGLINQWREEMIYNMIVNGWTLQKALEAMGFRIQTLVQNKIKSNVPPPLAESTVAHKQREGIGNQTLIESGLLLRSVTYKVYMK